MALTALAINAAKPKDKPYKLSDELGLCLLIMPTGGRLWRFNYRFGGKQKTLSLGNYPDLPLAKARAMRAAAREALAEGRDPAQIRKDKQREERARSQDTFQGISKEWLGKLERDGRSTSTISKLRWLLDFAKPDIGDRPITELTAPELLDVLRKIELRGRHETANRLCSTSGTIFRYAIVTGRAQYDVSANLKGALVTPKTKHYAAVTDPDILGGLLRAINAYDGAVPQRLALPANRLTLPGSARGSDRAIRARRLLTDRRAHFFINMPCRHAAGPMTTGLAGFLRVRRPSRRRP